MIQLSLLAFLLNGMFVNMEYYDLPYHWVAVVATMKVIVARELSVSRVEDTNLAPAAAAMTA
jgi:hypothetical protein